MNPTCCRGVRIGAFAFLAALGIAFLAADLADAQTAGGMTWRGPAKGGRGKPDRPGQQPRDDVQWTDTGRDRCRILDFEPLKEGGDEDVFGVLRIRPLPKKAKTLKLLVRRTEELEIRFDKGSDAALPLEMLSTLPLKNILCDASWGSAKRATTDDSGDKGKKKPSNSKEKELLSLTLETVEVEGKIESIEGDIVTIKAKPTGGAQWPDLELRQAGQTQPKAGAKTQRVPLRKLKLRLLDEVTSFKAGNLEPLELGDFKPEQEVEAVAVYGAKMGLMVVLRAPGVEGEKKVEPPPRERDRQPPPGGREGTRRGGGRPAKGGGI